MEDYDIVCDYFLDLSSPDRLKIIKLLQNGNFKISELAKKIDSTPQETHRNLQRLIRHELVDKTVDGKYQITDLGTVISTVTSIPKFVHSNRKFFQSKTIDNMPLKFLKRLGALEEGKRISGLPKVLQKCKSIYKNAENQIFDMVHESFPDIDKIAILKINNGCEYRHLVSNNYLEDEDTLEHLESIGYLDALKNKKIKSRKIASVEFSIIINEQEAAVIFPDQDLNPDLRTMFYGNDEYFYDWCLDFFKYNWKRAENYSLVNLVKNAKQ